jgi:hypothetical protein
MQHDAELVQINQPDEGRRSVRESKKRSGRELELRARGAKSNSSPHMGED